MSFHYRRPASEALQAIKGRINAAEREFSFVDIAAIIAQEAHEGRTRASGDSYFAHVLEVAEGPERFNSIVQLPAEIQYLFLLLPHKPYSPEQKAAAYLHDVLQKADLKSHDLESLGIPKNVIDAVWALTPRPKRILFGRYAACKCQAHRTFT